MYSPVLIKFDFVQEKYKEGRGTKAVIHLKKSFPYEK